MPTIGIPRALFYYKYYPFLAEYFKCLDCEVVVSPKTNKQIMANGIKLAIDESCLSMKIFLGHVNELVGKVDYLCILRVESTIEGEEMCTRMFALPDNVRNIFDGVRMIAPDIILNDFAESLFEQTNFISRDTKKKKRAFDRASLKLEQSFKECTEVTTYDSVYRIMHNMKYHREKQEESDINVALMGHSYNIYDNFIGFNVASKLQAMGVGIKTLEMLPLEESHRKAREVSSDMYWTYNKEMLGATKIYIDDNIDGVIFLTTFPCGPDALSNELAIRTFKNQVPILNLVYDELESDTGLDTRLETYVDMMRFRNNSELQ